MGLEEGSYPALDSLSSVLYISALRVADIGAYRSKPSIWQIPILPFKKIPDNSTFSANIYSVSLKQGAGVMRWSRAREE